MTSSSLQGRLLGGAYRVGALLGQGSMGAVYEAVDERLGRPVALKVLRADVRLAPEDIARFEREARAAAALGHPNIVQVTDFRSLPDEPPFLVMERLVGESLGAMIARCRALEPGQACFFATQMLDALGAAHRAGIVHRDVKPDNVFLTAVGGGVFLVKLVDFGLAKLLREAPITALGTLMGTPAYMAPEQALGGPVDARADLYSVAATLYHALSGRLPIDESAALIDILTCILERPPPSLRSLVPGLDPRLSDVIERAMAKDRGQRFPSADAFREALGPFVRASSAMSAPSAVPRSALAASVVGPPGGPPPVASSVFSSGAPPGGPPPVAVASLGPGSAAHGCRAGSTSSSGLWLALVGGVVLVGALAVGMAFVFLAHKGREAQGLDGGPGGAPSSSAHASAPGSPSSAEPSASPPGSASPRGSAPGGRGSREDAGPRFADAAAPPVADAATPRGVDAAAPPLTLLDAGATDAGMARGGLTFEHRGRSFSPFGVNFEAALKTLKSVDLRVRGCLPHACLGIDKNLEDYPILDVNYIGVVQGDGHVSKIESRMGRGRVNVSCPALDACVLPIYRGLKFPTPDKPGEFQFGLRFKDPSAR